MRRAIKLHGKIVQAYRLGTKHPVIDELLEKGLIRKMGSGKYQLFSQEAVNGSGQEAVNGDYVRLDSTGHPYPNSSEYVEKNLRHVGGDDFEQIPSQVEIWTIDDEMCPEIKFLIRCKKLTLNENDEKKYFTAPLWGTFLSAARNAVIVFYEIERDKTGKIMDAEFNFVERKEFEKTYKLLG